MTDKIQETGLPEEDGIIDATATEVAGSAAPGATPVAVVSGEQGALTSTGVQVQTLLNAPTFAALEKHSPQFLELAKAMKDEIKLDLMALSTFGSDAAEGLRDNGLEIVENVLDAKSAQLSVEALAIQNRLAVRLQQLKMNLNEGKEALREEFKDDPMAKELLGYVTEPGLGQVARDTAGKIAEVASNIVPVGGMLAPVKRTVSSVKDSVQGVFSPLVKLSQKVTDPSGKKAKAKEMALAMRKAEVEEKVMRAVIQGQSEGSMKIRTALTETLSDIIILQKLFSQHKGTPGLVYEQLQTSEEKTREAQILSYLQLTAMHEKRSEVEAEILELRSKMTGEQAGLDDVARLEQLTLLTDVMEGREQYLKGTFGRAEMQLRRNSVMRDLAVKAAIRLSGQENDVLSSLGNEAGQLSLQDAMAQAFVASKVVYRMDEKAQKSSTEGLAALVQSQKELDEMQAKSLEMIASTAKKTGELIGTWATNKAEAKKRLRGAGDTLVQGVAQLVSTSERVKAAEQAGLMGEGPLGTQTLTALANCKPELAASAKATALEAGNVEKIEVREPARPATSSLDRLKAVRAKAAAGTPEAK